MTFIITAAFVSAVVYFAVALAASLRDCLVIRHRNHLAATTEPDWAALSDEMGELIQESERALFPSEPDGFVAPAIAPVIATANLYQQCTIRQLKKLASGRIKRYSNMTKPELIAALA